MTKAISLEQLNQLSSELLSQRLTHCCTSEAWVTALIAKAPFEDVQTLQAVASDIWQGLAELDYLQAFEGHPKIGDINSLKAKYRSTTELASDEQSGMQSASDQVIAALNKGNQTYFEKFGFIFIVCASGLSAAEMLEKLNVRLHNSPDIELQLAANEQEKIFALRINKMLGQT